MKKKHFWAGPLFMLLIFQISCGTPGNEEEKPEAERPNIVFIMTDDHSYQTLSAYDDRFIETPNIDRIAEEGVKFVNSFVGNSICAPSRATLLTGKHSHKNGQIDNRTTFDGSQPTFPKYLRETGYQTALIGKWHLRSTPTGYDHWDRLIGQGDYYNTEFITNGDTSQTDGYVTDVITDRSLEWLENRDSNRPFALQIHHKAVHRIWMPDTSLLSPDGPEPFTLPAMEGGEDQAPADPNKLAGMPATFFDDYEGRRAASEQKMSIAEDMDLVYDLKMLDEDGELQTKYRKAYANGRYSRLNEEQKAVWDAYYDPIIEDFMDRREQMSDIELARWKYQRYMRDYLKTVQSVDKNVGRVLDYLKENGLYENTLVVYTSDQGFYMGEHGWFDKRFMYEQSMRTPLLMKFPEGMDTRREVDELVQNIDYAPTLLDLAGVKVPEDMQGRSMVPLVQDADTDWRDALYYHYYEFPNEHMVKRHYGIRTDRYKLIHFYNDIDDWELYDLKEDPMEMNDLYGKEGYEELTEQLKARLAELQEQYDDTDRSTY
ncbi:Arylsulfatase A [Fodinibius sediminis]|uniref:Arylsulfatase A n=2 Tax=Fodinibius sediminis TaxID=1214077 RepID=A0A521EAQ0_9BACT|nr:sulfatase [Fodinibius sediminis]SMO80994.1 Arylsulfatase A [Fodinibius sediminis]